MFLFLYGEGKREREREGWKGDIRAAISRFVIDDDE
jgi:hypothetical protein